MLWWVQLAMCQLHRILLSNSMSWLILFVHLCRGPRNIRQYLLIIVDMKEEFAVGDRVLLDASNLSIPGVHKFR